MPKLGPKDLPQSLISPSERQLPEIKAAGNNTSTASDASDASKVLQHHPCQGDEIQSWKLQT